MKIRKCKEYSSGFTFFLFLYTIHSSCLWLNSNNTVSKILFRYWHRKINTYIYAALVSYSIVYMKATQNKIRTWIGCVIYNLASYWLKLMGLIGLLDYDYVTLPRCYVGSTKVSVFCVALN